MRELTSSRVAKIVEYQTVDTVGSLIVVIGPAEGSTTTTSD
jgi:hypothetical protein